MPIDDLVRHLKSRGFELIQTHISWVLLDDTNVYKIKKPVDFGFLDFSTLEARRDACEAEVRLNRRLSPDVYRGVVPITEGPDGTRLGTQDDGEVVDWAVHMRRLADVDRADVRLAQGRLSFDEVAAIARRIAEFHDAAPTDAEVARFGETDRIGDNVRENFEQTQATVGHYLQPEQFAEVERFQLGFLQTHADRFAARVEAGRVRDGHGDLRLEHVYLGDEGELAILDCIEFNDRFRYGDVCADIAFLAMDLARLGHVELSEWCLAEYARAADDFDLYGVVDFYESYRAYVRAKIATIVAEGHDAPWNVRQRASEEARRDYLLALSADRKLLLGPILIAVGGIIATGKSTVANAIARERSAPVIDADRTRKHLVGARPTDPIHTEAFAGAYGPAVTERVYAELRRRAQVVLDSGRPVILDASFRSRAQRQHVVALARELGVPLRFVECRVDPDVCKARLRARAQGPSVSDGRLEIFDDFVASWEAVDELDAGEHLVVDTGQPLDETLDAIRAAVATWPRGLDA